MTSFFRRPEGSYAAGSTGDGMLGPRGARRSWTRRDRAPYLVLLCALGTGTAFVASGGRRDAGAGRRALPSAVGHAAPLSALRATGVPWVVLPTFNEAENIEGIVATVVSVLEQAAPGDFRILIVDDDSPDGTGAIADRLAAGHDGIEVLHRSEREGLGPAYVAGFRHALARGAGYVLEMDADGSHDPRDLARLLAAVQRGSTDLALGSRYVADGEISNWSMLRRATSRGGCWYARKVLGLDVRDLTGGFKCFAAEVLDAIDLASLRSCGYAFQVELTYRAVRAGFRVQEVPITFRDREYGSSKMSWRIALEAAWRVPQLRCDAGRRRPLRAFARIRRRRMDSVTVILARLLTLEPGTRWAKSEGQPRTSLTPSTMAGPTTAQPRSGVTPVPAEVLKQYAGHRF
jgi:dolichol-phosphate mannosyltransferase